MTPPVRTGLLCIGIIAFCLSLVHANDPFPKFSSAEEVERTVMFPEDAGVVDVTQEPYNAKGDGKTDNTEALQRAITDHLNFRSGSRILYFPAGTYLVSDTLTWQNKKGKWFNYLSLQGENRDRSIIRLMDSSSGFDNPETPRAVIRTGSLGRWKQNGNAGFSNYISDVTISTGNRNPGAIGIDYLGNNDTALRNLHIRSEDGEGVAGFASIRSNGGPYLAKNMEITGFNYGVCIARSWYSHIFEYLVLNNPANAGIRIEPAYGLNPQGPLLSARRVTLNGEAPLLQQEDPSALAVISEAFLNRPDGTKGSAVLYEGAIYLKDIHSTHTTQFPGKQEGTHLKEFTSQPDPLTGAVTGAPQFPVEETPYIPPAAPADWVSVTSFGADPSDEYDDAPAIQEALNSGAAVIYFPTPEKTNDYYRIESTLRVPASVTHVIGMNCRIKPPKGHPDFYATTPPTPVFLIEETGDVPLTMERMKIDEFWHFGKIASIQHNSDRTLILRELIMENYSAGPGAGTLFLESVACAEISLPPGGSTYARHLNPETIGDKVLNNGGDFWCLGLKSEQASTLLRTVGGGRSVVLGALQTASPPIPDDVPMFVVDEHSSMGAAFLTRTNSERQRFFTLIKNQNKPDLTLKDAPGRPYNEYDALVPFSVSGSSSAPGADGRTFFFWDNASAEPLILRAGHDTKPAEVTVKWGSITPKTDVEKTPKDSAEEAPSAFETITVSFTEKQRSQTVEGIKLKKNGADILNQLVLVSSGQVGWPSEKYMLPPAQPNATADEANGTVLSLSADQGIELDSDLGVILWQDLSGFNHRVDSVTRSRRPKWTMNGIAPGENALRFEDDKLEIHVATPLHGRTLSGRTWAFRFRSNEVSMRKQMLYHEGAGRRGVACYLENGQLHMVGWNKADDGLNSPWPFAHLSAPLPEDKPVWAAFVLDAHAPSLTLYLDGEPVAKTENVGVFGRHTGGRSFIGVQHQNVQFPDEPLPESTPVEGRGGHPFSGYLSHVLVFNRSLSQEEIKDTLKMEVSSPQHSAE